MSNTVSEQLLLVDRIIALAICLSHVTFFSFLALAIGEPYTKVLYTKLSTNNDVGWSQSVQLRPPSVLTADELKIVYDNIDAIKFVGKFMCGICKNNTLYILNRPFVLCVS